MKDKEKYIDNSWKAKMVEKGIYKDSEITSGEKQIEEMAKEIEKAKQHIWASVRTQAEDEDYLWHSRAIAELLMLQGYRNGKDKVLLSREEYERLKGERKPCNCETLVNQARKETAEKILDKVDNESNGQTKQITDLLRKQFGVEIKE